MTKTFFTVLALTYLPTVANSLHTISTDKSAIKFYYYNDPRDSDAYKDITNATIWDLQNFGFLPNKPIVIFAHGLFDSPFSKYTFNVQKTSRAYSSSNLNANFVAIDWSPLSNCSITWLEISLIFPLVVDTTVCYIQAVRNMPTAGQVLVEKVEWLIKQGYTDDQHFHLIGHSLGAQMIGLAGKLFQRRNPGCKLARITGLDPAGPLFEFPLTISEGLTKDSAHFVDCIFTNVYFEGSFEAVGHANFYVNGGVFQPNCGLNIDCNHEIATTLYALSFKLKFVACQCDFPFGQCDHRCLNPTMMGVNCPPTARGSFAIKTYMIQPGIGSIEDTLNALQPPNSPWG